MTNKKSKHGTTDRIAISQVKEIIANSGKRVDAMRAEGFAALVNVKRAKLVQTRRERARIAERYGESSEKTLAINRKMEVEHRFLVNSRAESARLATPALEPEADSWQVHGYIRDQDGFARAGYSVGVYTDKNGRHHALMTTASNHDGYFHMRWKPPSSNGKKAATAETSEAKAGATNIKPDLSSLFHAKEQIQRVSVYLGVRGPKQMAATMDTSAMRAVAGTVSYRDMVVLDESDDASRCRFATRLLGDSATRKLHNLKNPQSGCRLAAIPPANRVYFESEAQAKRLGYDLCTICFGFVRAQK